MDVLGLDIGKFRISACLLKDAGNVHLAFDNNPAGFTELLGWLKKHRGSQPAGLHACMEATGNYGLELAASLVSAGFIVSIVNPAQIKAFEQAELARNKPDKLDAAVIARFCRALATAAWTPPPHVLMLRELVRRCASLKEQRTQKLNRQKAAPAVDLVKASIARSLTYLNQEIALISAEIRRLIGQHADLTNRFDLLTSIPGIGDVGAAVLMAEIPNIAEFTPKGLAAFAGLSPAEHNSGQQKRGIGISSIGNATVRNSLYLGALSACRYNPMLKDFVARMKAANKVILIAVARELLIMAYAIIRSGQRFDPTFTSALIT